MLVGYTQVKKTLSLWGILVFLLSRNCISLQLEGKLKFQKVTKVWKWTMQKQSTTDTNYLFWFSFLVPILYCPNTNVARDIRNIFFPQISVSQAAITTNLLFPISLSTFPNISAFQEVCPDDSPLAGTPLYSTRLQPSVLCGKEGFVLQTSWGHKVGLPSLLWNSLLVCVKFICGRLISIYVHDLKFKGQAGSVG